MGIYINMKFHNSVAYHVMIFLQKSRKQIYKKNFGQQCLLNLNLYARFGWNNWCSGHRQIREELLHIIIICFKTSFSSNLWGYTVKDTPPITFVHFLNLSNVHCYQIIFNMLHIFFGLPGGHFHPSSTHQCLPIPPSNQPLENHLNRCFLTTIISLKVFFSAATSLW